MASYVYSGYLYFKGNENDVKKFINELDNFLSLEDNWGELEDYYFEDSPASVFLSTTETRGEIWDPLLPLMGKFPELSFFYRYREYLRHICGYCVFTGAKEQYGDEYDYFIEEDDEEEGEPLEENYSYVFKEKVEPELNTWLDEK